MRFDQSSPFASFFKAGFECSSHRRRDGVRLDLIRATRHDRYIGQDYAACRALGMLTVRDGLRWHLIEKSPGHYDWSSWLPALEAAEEHGLQVIWDLFHYGAPDHVDMRSADFPERFRDFALAALEIQQSISASAPLICPLNEISFMSWAVEEGYFPVGGAVEPGSMKRQLVRCGTVAAAAIRERWPATVFVWAEPAIHVAPKHGGREEVEVAERARLSQYEAYDWLTGQAAPELGGRADLVDIVGLNFYPHNQWFRDGTTVPMGHHEYRPLADILQHAAERYGRPVMVAETGAEGSARPAWLHYVCDEVREAQSRGVRVDGICLYPVTAYPGWDNSRHCEVGLFSEAASDGARTVDQRTLEELQRQRQLMGVDVGIEAAGGQEPRLRAAGRGPRLV